MDTQEDKNVDDNQNSNALPNDNIAQAEAPMEQNDRPQRSRRPPKRLEYYIPGQPGYIQSAAVCTMCAQRFQPQLPYAPFPCWPQPNSWVYPYGIFTPFTNPYLLY